MANTIEYAKVFQKELDKQVLEGATSGWMEENAGQVKYSGGNEVKIPKISLSGLGDYDRDSGYTQGAVTFSYETKTMTMDRGRKFLLDKMDVDETDFVASAATVMGEFQRTQVIPELHTGEQFGGNFRRCHGSGGLQGVAAGGVALQRGGTGMTFSDTITVYNIIPQQGRTPEQLRRTVVHGVFWDYTTGAAFSNLYQICSLPRRALRRLPYSYPMWKALRAI